jgi:hypothetical protein
MKRIHKILVAMLFVIAPYMASAQTYVKLNALYAPVGVINPSVEVAMSKHSSMVLDITYSPWKSWQGKHSEFGIMLGEYRYYFKEATSGWYLSANTGMLLFDIHRFQFFKGGKLISRQDQYGKGFGMGIGGGVGWSRHLGERWLVDIYISVDKTWTWYNRYTAEGDIIMNPQGHEHYLKPDPFNGSAEVMPLKGGISFGYRILKGKK